MELDAQESEGSDWASGLMGKLLAGHAWVIAAEFHWHVLESGGPAVKKSSR